MYRQINIFEPHRRYQRILWRFSLDEPVQSYQLNRVTFGIKSSPFLSLRTIKQLISDEFNLYLEDETYVNQNMYMDDFICFPNSKKTIEIYSQLMDLFKAGGFRLEKWMSNSTELLAKIPNELKLTQLVEFDKNTIKVLGLQWNPSSDKFNFKLDLEKTPCTKRNMLSLITRTVRNINPNYFINTKIMGGALRLGPGSSS